MGPGNPKRQQRSVTKRQFGQYGRRWRRRRASSETIFCRCSWGGAATVLSRRIDRCRTKPSRRRRRSARAPLLSHRHRPECCHREQAARARHALADDNHTFGSTASGTSRSAQQSISISTRRRFAPCARGWRSHPTLDGRRRPS